MDNEANSVAQAFDDEDLNTTAPDPEPVEWTMPKPIFRKTSGRLPREFERHIGIAESIDEPVNGETPSEPNTPAEQINTYREPTPKNPTLKFLLVLLGLAAMIAFIAIFLMILYFFFLR